MPLKQKVQEEDKESNEQYAHSQFDQFLDAMAASLLNELPNNQSVLLNKDNTMMAPNRRKNSTEDVMMALLCGNKGDEDSGAEDNLILGGTSTNNYLGATSSFDGLAFANADAKMLWNFGFLLSGKNPRSDLANSTTIDTSFAKALEEGQGFFQCVISISTRHRFPPSKDPTGDQNCIHQFLQGKTLQRTKLLAATKKQPIDGVLPSGWLQNHLAALPPVILVVVQVTQNRQPHKQDKQCQRTKGTHSVVLTQGDFCDCSPSMTPKPILPSLVAWNKCTIIQCDYESASKSLMPAAIIVLVSQWIWILLLMTLIINLPGSSYSGPGQDQEECFPGAFHMTPQRMLERFNLLDAWRHALSESNDGDGTAHLHQMDSNDPDFDYNDKPSSKYHRDFDDDDNASIGSSTFFRNDSSASIKPFWSLTL
jgi:hypothetical protein